MGLHTVDGAAEAIVNGRLSTTQTEPHIVGEQRQSACASDLLIGSIKSGTQDPPLSTTLTIMASAAASPSTAAAAAKTCLSLRGIISVLNTPFIRSSGSLVVDTASLVGAVQVALDAGVAGFLVAGLAAEVGLLTHEERGALLETVVATVRKAGRPVPVIAGASAPTTEARQALAKAALAAGADAVLVNLPFKAGEAAAYTASVHEVANVINEHNAKRGSGAAAWLMLQDWDPVGSGVPTALLSSLFADVPCFRSYKCEVVGAGAKYSAVLAACGGKLHVCGGWAVTQLIEALDRGVHAFMPTGQAHTASAYCLCLLGSPSRGWLSCSCFPSHVRDLLPHCLPALYRS